VSGLARRTVLSTAVLFLLAGFLLGDGMLSVLPVGVDDPIVSVFAELALFSVLFTDGMRVGVRDLRRAWRLPGRALLLGMPFTLVLIAVLAHYVAGLGWLESFLLAAVLSPTDPVFASALVGHAGVPRRLRHLLNVESGVNDGLALPLVVLLLAVTAGNQSDPLVLAEEIAVGVAVGVGITGTAILLERLPFFSASAAYQPLNGFAIGLLVYGVAQLTHGNLFLAAFAAGITVASIGPAQRESFEHFGELIAEVLKLAALLVFGALISPQFLAEIPLSGYLFAVLVLVAARPVGLGLALLGSQLGRREKAAALWFGPKGFASVVYALLVLNSGIPPADELFHLAALVIGMSIVAHASTDVLVARQFADPDQDNGDEDGGGPDVFTAATSSPEDPPPERPAS
jgi:NhaP-type Na+/H+ or K+/H+ antiporter